MFALKRWVNYPDGKLAVNALGESRERISDLIWVLHHMLHTSISLSLLCTAAN